MKKYLMLLVFVASISSLANAMNLQCTDNNGQNITVAVSGEVPFDSATVQIVAPAYYGDQEGSATPVLNVGFTQESSDQPGGNSYFKAFFNDGLGRRNWSITIDQTCVLDPSQPQPGTSFWTDWTRGGNACSFSATCEQN